MRCGLRHFRRFRRGGSRETTTPEATEDSEPSEAHYAFIVLDTSVGPRINARSSMAPCLACGCLHRFLFRF